MGRVLVTNLCFVLVVAALSGCGQNIPPNVRRGLLRSTSVPRSVPDAGPFRPAGPKSTDGTPVRGTLR